jgi:hypothetical protein
MMSEFELIEIAKRFRRLEDAIEAADRVLGIVDDLYPSVRVALTRRRPPIDLTEIRNDLESVPDLCRDDMVAMQEAIRSLK